MPLGLSRASQYALRALVHLAHLPAGDAETVQAIADAEGVPQPFLAKVIRRLVAEGIVTSTRGPGGGMRLARDPASIPVLDVVTGVDGADPWSACFLGMPRCNADKPCPMHETWKPMREQLQAELHAQTIADLAALDDFHAGRRAG